MNSARPFTKRQWPFARKSGSRGHPGELELDRAGRGGVLRWIRVPADECRTLEAIIKDDLQRAKILSVSVYVDEDGQYRSGRTRPSDLRRREVVLAPEMRSKAPVSPWRSTRATAGGT